MLGSRVAEVVEMPVFGADHDVRDTVVVEINHGRAGRVSRKPPRIERSPIFEIPFAVARFCLTQPTRIGAIDEEVQLAVAVKISNTELSPTACAGLLGVELTMSIRPSPLTSIGSGHAHRPAPRSTTRPG